MSHVQWSACFRALLLTAAMMFVGSPESAAFQLCHGCQGSGGTDYDDSGGDCPSGSSISITVHVLAGVCLPEVEYPVGVVNCSYLKGCKITVYRTWAGLPANCAFEYCVQFPGWSGPRCIHPPPNSGSEGSGAAPPVEYEIPCQNGNYTWSFTVVCCSGRSASVQGTCSKCIH